MISIVIQAKNIRTGFRKRITDIAFPILKQLEDCEVIVSDYGSEDDTENFVKDIGLKYVYTEPNEGEFINMSKCLNNAIVNHAKYDIISPSGTDFIYPNNFAKSVKSMYGKFDKNKLSYTYMMVMPKEYDIDIDSYQLLERTNSFDYMFPKEMYYRVGGFDERIFDWGGEDSDIRSRFKSIIGEENITERVPDDIVLLHIKHPIDFENTCRKIIHRDNMKIQKENTHTDGANIENSYLNVNEMFDKYGHQ